MKQNMTIQEAFRVLYEFYGNHMKAAAGLGYEPRHYRALRNGAAHIPPRVETFIIDRARLVSGEITHDNA